MGRPSDLPDVMEVPRHLSDTQAPRKRGLKTKVSPFREMWEEGGGAELTRSSSENKLSPSSYAHWYFFITFCLLKCLYSVTRHIHVEKAVHRVRVLSTSCNLLDLIKTSE